MYGVTIGHTWLASSLSFMLTNVFSLRLKDEIGA